MIRGRFLENPQNVPVVELTLAWGIAIIKQFFILDTGFTGDLKISKEKAEELGLDPIGAERISFADNRSTEAPIALAYTAMEDVTNKQAVSVVIDDGAPLVGIGLLTKFGYKATIDCKWRTVELEKSV